MNASTILARRAAAAASRRLSTRFLTTTAANETAASSAPNTVGKSAATNRMMHYRRCGGPVRGVAKVGVLGLAGYGGYQLVFKPNHATAATTTGAVVDNTSSSA